MITATEAIKAANDCDSVVGPIIGKIDRRIEQACHESLDFVDVTDEVFRKTGKSAFNRIKTEYENRGFVFGWRSSILSPPRCFVSWGSD